MDETTISCDFFRRNLQKKLDLVNAPQLCQGQEGADGLRQRRHFRPVKAVESAGYRVAEK